jgi:uncharacterized protein (DUF1501 family)
MHLTRRRLLIDGLKVTALVPALPALGHAARLGRAAADGRVLVVLQLTGGNDGLNTVVPHAQDEYYRARPNLGLARGALHALDEDHGLHPQMSGLGELFQEGRLAIVHGVGLPYPDRSHFRSYEIWHSARPSGPPGEVGWLGRLADQLAQREPGILPALAVEGGHLPLSMRGEHFLAPTVRDPRGFRTAEASARFADERDALVARDGAGDLGFLRAAARATYATARRMTEITSQAGGVEYPGSDLARRCALVAQLIAGDFGTRIFHLSLGGFDTHSRQAPVHADLAQRLSGALTAFQRDLEQRGVAERVVTFVFSEFGRRARENGSKGTDHGNGAPAFLLGARLRGGMHGTPPDLAHLVDGDVPVTTDFRRLYTLLERDWLGLEPSSDQTSLGILT